MGSDPAQDKFALEDELPQHYVYLPEYYIGKAPVTNAQYMAFVQATSHRRPLHWVRGKFPVGRENHPVMHVTWRDALVSLSECPALSLSWGHRSLDPRVEFVLRCDDLAPFIGFHPECRRL